MLLVGSVSYNVIARRSRSVIARLPSVIARRPQADEAIPPLMDYLPAITPAGSTVIHMA